jgi:hypothetical protein
MDHTRDPCPWVILNDFGGAFSMGVSAFLTTTTTTISAISHFELWFARLSGHTARLTCIGLE